VPPAADNADSSMPHAAAAEGLRLQHLEIAARYLFTNLLPLPFVIVGLGLMLAAWHRPAPIVAWGLASTLTWMATIGVIRAFLKDADKGAHIVRWTIALCAAIFVSAAVFASVAPLFWVEGERLNNVLLYVLVAASLASAGAQSAPSAPVVIANLTPYALVFLHLSLANEAFPMNVGVAFLQLCYIVLVALYARTVWQLADDMLRLRLEKRELIDRLQDALVEATKAKQKAEAASSAKSEFLANMSHELRTPLNAILGFSEIIKDRVLGEAAAERYSEYGGHIHFSGRHLLGLIGDILDLSKIEAGKRELDERDVDLVEIARDALRFVEPQAQRKSLCLKFDGPARAVVRADERAMRQIIANLLSNAVKFTPNAGAVSLRVTSDPSAGIAIAVADTGVGIKPEDMSKIMESFGQARHDVATTDEQGTGLGLPIVKGLVALHGGTLKIDSTPGKGTTVTVTLPAERMIGVSGIVSAA
jgi:two-component system cell cycle sensor histidine kinase PleC